MHYLLTICIAFFGFALLIDSKSVTEKTGADNLYLDCLKFKRDLDVLRSFSYSVQLNPMITVNKTYAVMNSNSQIEELIIYHEISLPLSVFCLAHLHTLRVSGTPFVSQFELDDTSISTGLSPLISRLSQLRVLSLVNTTASHIPHHALAALTNLTSLEIENCGLRELPPTIALLTKLQILKLPMNHLKSLPDKTDSMGGISNLKSLTEVLLSYNRLDSLVPLHNLSKLIYLNASNNNIVDISDLADIASSVLFSLDLSFNQIDHIPPQISRFTSSLRYLYLNNNQLDYIPTDIFRLKSLLRADLRQNPFPTAELTAIKARFRTDIPSCTLVA